MQEAVRAEALGYDEIWAAEAAGWDAVALLSAVAVRTTRARLGAGVLNVTSRSAYALAAAAASVAALSGDRFALGLGSSSPQIVRHWHGGDAGDPVGQVERAISRVRVLLNGGRLEDPPLRARLAEHPAARVPLYMAALGPRMVQAAARSADGIVSVFVTPDWLAELNATLTEHGARPEIVARLFVPVPGDDADTVDGMRDLLASYAAVPAYLRHFGRLGFGAAADRAAAALRAREPGAARRAITDDMISALTVLGTPEEQFAQVRTITRAGADVALLAFFPHGRHDHGDPDVLAQATGWFAARWPGSGQAKEP